MLVVWLMPNSMECLEFHARTFYLNVEGYVVSVAVRGCKAMRRVRVRATAYIFAE